MQHKDRYALPRLPDERLAEGTADAIVTYQIVLEVDEALR